MRKGLLALFSGFPEHHFSPEITERLRAELTKRDSIVFITACPLDHEQNDDDCDGMYKMFTEQGLSFAKHCVIDKRTEPETAKKLVENADCIFLMGGGVCEEQLDLIREKECYDALTDCHAAIFGVSAGAMNMARNTVDFFESMEPFRGLGLTNITVSCHHDPEDLWRYEQTLRMSEERTVYAMEDLSAFFIKEGRINVVGTIYRVKNREFKTLTEEDIKELEQDEFRRVFDTIPDQFDKFRPHYSEELFTYLINEAGIGPGKRVLEIGPGTGQATEPVLRTGCEYHAIELGGHLYRKMKEKYGKLSNFNIVNDDFITYDFGDMKFDMIYSAATIQWIPEDVAFAKTFGLLKPGGTLAMLLTTSEYRSDNEVLYEKIQAMYDRYYKPDILYIHGQFRYTAAPEYGYTEVERYEFKGQRVFTADDYVAFCGTHSDHIVIPEQLRTEFFEGLRNAVLEAGDRIVFNDTYVLYLARKAKFMNNRKSQNPWREISLEEYENHMRLDSVMQLQTLNKMMKTQLSDYDVSIVMILGVAGGNGLEHIDKNKYKKVYGVDINENYLKKVAERYSSDDSLGGILECILADLTKDAESLPGAELVIADLLIEYIGYDAFATVIQYIKPKYVSCIIQINTDTENWVSESPYLHSFDGLDAVHHQMDEKNLIKIMGCKGYVHTGRTTEMLPNGKALVRVDFTKN